MLPRALKELIRRNRCLCDGLRKIRYRVKCALGKELLCTPDVDLPGREFHGTEYGGYFVLSDGLSSSSVVYSFGIGEDISFDLSIIEKYGVSIFAFDPTPRSRAYIESLGPLHNFHFHELGISNSDGTVRFFPPVNPDYVSCSIFRAEATEDRSFEVPVKRLGTIAQILGHKQIDILKMDIEGAEYDVIPDILASGISIGQILLEFHHGSNGTLVGADILPVSVTRIAIQQLRKAGYRMFASSPFGHEYSFVKEVPVYYGSQRAGERDLTGPIE